MQTFNVQVMLHPIRQDRVGGQVEVGPTLAAMGATGSVDCWVNGERWEDMAYAPAAGDHVVLRPALQGGGGDDGNKDTLRLVATIVVLVVASYAAPAVAGALGVSEAVAFAGVSMVGNLAVSALVPPSVPNLDLAGALSARPEAKLTGIRNQLAPFAVIPRLYGTHRFFPPLAARPFTEQVGEDQYLRTLFCLGYGPLDVDVSSFKIGDTLLTEFTDYQLEVLEGKPTDPPLTLYANNVNEEGLVLPFDVNGDTHTRTTDSTTAAVSLDISAPALIKYDKNGKMPACAVFKIEYQPSAGGAWVLMDNTNVTVRGDGGWAPNAPVDIFAGFRGRLASDIIYTEVTPIGPGFYIVGDGEKPYTATFEFQFPVAGEYNIRITRIGAFWGDVGGFSGANNKMVVYNAFEPDPNNFTEFSWRVLRSIGGAVQDFAPDGLAFVAMRIKATDQLSGHLDTFSCVATARIPVWNGTSWVEGATSNPAYVYRHMLTGGSTLRPLDVARLDDADLIEWAGDCTALALEFNGIFDGRTTLANALDAVASAGRASRQIRDGRYSVIVDKVQDQPVQVFTPRNSWEFAGERAYTSLPHGIKVRFANREADWQRDERVVYADGYSADGTACYVPGPGSSCQVATEFETLTLFGETDPAAAFKHGRYHLAVAALRPESFTFMVDVENVICTRGDRVQIQQDSISVGVGSGRVLSVVDGGSGATQVRTDETWEIEGGNSYAVRIRRADGSILIRNVTTGAGTTQVLDLDSPAPNVAAGDLLVFGEVGQEVIDGIVKSIEPGPDLTARLVVVPYAPAVFNAHDSPIPAYAPSVAAAVDSPDAPVINYATNGVESGSYSNDSARTAQVKVGFRFPSSAVGAAFVDYSIRALGEKTWETGPRQENNGAVAFVVSDPRQSYEVRVRGVSADGKAGPWTTATAEGDTTAPAQVSGATATGGLDKVVVRWTNPEDQDFAYTEVYRGTAAGFTPDETNLLLQSAARGPVELVDSDVLPDTGYYYKFQTQDAAGNLSGYSAAVGPASPQRITAANATTFLTAGAIRAQFIKVDGSIQVEAGGAVYSGKIAFETLSAGFWLGTEGGVGKLHVGNASTFFKWDGSALELRGTFRTNSVGSDRIEVVKADNRMTWYESSSQVVRIGMSGADKSGGKPIVAIDPGSLIYSGLQVKRGTSEEATLGVGLGFGGSFWGSKAAVGIIKGASTAAPSHFSDLAGFYVNASGDLYYNKGGTSTWAKLN